MKTGDGRVRAENAKLRKAPPKREVIRRAPARSGGSDFMAIRMGYGVIEPRSLIRDVDGEPGARWITSFVFI